VELTGVDNSVDGADNTVGSSALHPVRLASWPRMILTPTALMNPTITAFETNRSTGTVLASVGEH
jgi:hypothetical protein